ncbi:MarR family winged helix-turn-helix transcriptional regulator [Teichococcus oryzae]|uniref:MarR family transcriptional regulator n=1 Tax=Teichococcus oryzae TaxID=1608942 RepID=A0A5B2TF99_9PROT|nr:MarR family transcriptional regulator [Pseudoroseomonas oryzae]KAA2212685.1 MarR family transcriptional regulator [Pseudoroseomonas oryzae]
MELRDAALREALLTEIAITGRKVRTVFDRLMRARGMTLPRARLMLHLAKHQAVNQTELAAVLELEHPTLVRLLDGLERQGLIRRSAVPGDRRAKQVMLTAEAMPQLREVEQVVATLRAALLDGIGADELAVTSAVLDRILRNVEACGGGGTGAAPKEEP